MIEMGGLADAVQESRSMTRFFTIFTGQAFSLFGSRLVQFAIVWWLTVASGSASFSLSPL